jgi:hypothetical protein
MQTNQNSGATTEQLVTLYRPVGLREFALLWDSSFGRFPQRLPGEPDFTSVCDCEHARHIAADLNVKDPASVFSGFVTKFNVQSSFISRFNPRVVDSNAHQEYRLPVQKFEEFNRSINGKIALDSAFFGPAFQGYVPGNSILKGKKAIEQFVQLAKTWEYSALDFCNEVSVNRKAVFLNSCYWAQHDFADVGIPFEQKLLMFERLRNAWDLKQIEIPWPAEQISEMLSVSATARLSSPGASPSRQYQNARSRAGGRVDNVLSDESIDAQDDFREKVKREERRRPAVVTGVSVGLFIYAAYFLILVILGFGRPDLWKTGDIDRDSMIVFQLSFVWPIRVVMGILFGVGIFSLKWWARRALLITAGLDLARAFLLLILSRGSTRYIGLSREITIVFAIAIIACLASPKASLAFERSSGT